MYIQKFSPNCILCRMEGEEEHAPGPAESIGFESVQAHNNAPPHQELEYEQGQEQEPLVANMAQRSNHLANRFSTTQCHGIRKRDSVALLHLLYYIGGYLTILTAKSGKRHFLGPR